MSETNKQWYQLPGMPDLEEVERTLAEVKSGTLPPDEQARKEQYLLESAIAIDKALPTVEQLRNLTRG